MTEQLNSNKTVDLWKVLTAIAVVGSTLAVGGWVVGRAYLQDEISQYKETEKWKAPDVIRKITTLSERLSKQLDSISDYEALAKYKIYATGEIKRLTNLNQEIKQVNKNKLMEIEQQHKEHIGQLDIEKGKFQNRLSSLEAENSNLKETIEMLRGEIVVVNVGQAESVGHKSIRVGVNSLSKLVNYASITSGEYNNSTMKVGDNFSRLVDGKKYVITLVRINDESCEFSFDVFENKEP